MSPENYANKTKQAIFGAACLAAYLVALITITQILKFSMQ